MQFAGTLYLREKRGKKGKFSCKLSISSRSSKTYYGAGSGSEVPTNGGGWRILGKSHWMISRDAQQLPESPSFELQYRNTVYALSHGIRSQPLHSSGLMELQLATNERIAQSHPLSTKPARCRHAFRLHGSTYC